MNDKEILANAPDGATHVDNNGYYLKACKSGFMEPSDCGVDWDYDYASHCEVRSLSDIALIVELETYIDIALDSSKEQLIDRIAELEKEREELSAFKVIFGMGDGESVVTARQYINNLKLEQQAKGIDWVLACRELNLSEGEVHTLMDKYKQLREGVANE